MKLFRIAFCAAIFALTVGAIGQASAGDLVVDVPFAFSAAGQTLPAGHYIIKPERSNMIRILGNHNQSVFVPTFAALRTQVEGSKLVFHRYGDSYFLSQLWITGSTSGKELYPSKGEHELKTRQAEMELAVVRPAQ
jgi:hypothetical protein